MEHLLKLSPALSFKVWGGQKISKIKNIEALQSDANLGETWEISSHPDGPSRLASTKSCLNDLVGISYLFKYIDTSDNLSVQVHPDDDFAGEHENEKGKTECWLILDAEPGAGIYLGFRPGVTKKEFKTAVDAGMAVDHFLNFYPASPGDFFVVPAGAVHAIGKGVLLAECQQNSGVTYRVWDWNRMGGDGKPRELHIDKAMRVMRFDEGFNQRLAGMAKKSVWNEPGAKLLFRHADFRLDLISLRAGDRKELRAVPKEGFSLARGKALLDGEAYGALESCIATTEGLTIVEALEDCVLLSMQDLSDTNLSGAGFSGAEES